MLKIIGAVLGVLAIVVIGVVAFASTRPDSFQIQRAIVIDAPPEKIIPLIEDFHKWPQWSPFEKMDPAMTRTFGGAARGVGATYGWNGKKAGSGRMEITSIVPNAKVTIDLDFTKPMEAHNTAEFALAPKGTSTQVTWTMRGPSPLVSKVMGLFFNIDTMIGKDFEAGLIDLKTAAEA